MEKIKIELYRHENYLYGKVLEMPERLRGKGLIIRDEETGYRIISSYMPDLLSEKLFLSGETTTEDNKWFNYTFPSVEEAIEKKEIIEKLIKKWNSENASVLDKIERKYLRKLIAPFRNNIKFIRKTKYSEVFWQIEIIYNKYVNPYLDDFTTILPPFPTDTMYKGMKLGKQYTLEELGL